jgi:hypothetical protein
MSEFSRKARMKNSCAGFRAARFAAAAAAAMVAASLQAAAVPAPRDYFGFDLGSDRKLADWKEITAYFWKVGAASSRVRVAELGKTTEGRPFLMATISSPENLAKLERYRTIQQRLSDPRGLSDDAANALIREGKIVVLLTCNIHSTEIASSQTAAEFLYRIATENTPKVKAILDNVILLLVPSLNPDGEDMVVQWYRKTLGTPSEGSSPPFIYHHYTGHDNNRDWYMFTQVETQLTISKAQNVWHPQVVYDVHQMGPSGARIFMPPWVDPVEPGIDPALVSEMNWLGATMASDLIGEGKKGVVINGVYDLWTPGRHYQCYHGGLRILTESASVNIASPIDMPFEKLSPGRGYHAQHASWNFPNPWPGGAWHLRDIVDYQLSAFYSLLSTSAANREKLVRNFYGVQKRMVERKEGPYAFVIPANQKDPVSTAKMLETLRFGMVEMSRASAPFTADGREYPEGSRVITLAQPYGNFAKTLLEKQNYPDLREFPGGPPIRPYDVTAHTLPLLMGVNAITVKNPFPAKLVPEEHLAPLGGVGEGAAAYGYSIAPNGTYEIAAIFHLLSKGAKVSRLVEGPYSPGTALIASGATAGLLQETAKKYSIRISPVSQQPHGKVLAVAPPRIAIYRSHVASMDEGWTRWMFDQFGVPYVNIYDKDVRAGGLRDQFDAIILPDNSSRAIIAGNGSGGGRGGERRSSGVSIPYPAEYNGGIGEAGVKNLGAFAEAGGSLIAFNKATALIVESFGGGIKDALKGVSNRDFYCPGSILGVTMDTSSPLAFGMDAQSPIWFEESPAFEMGAKGKSIATYGASPLMSGWLLGGEKLNGKTALADLPIGKGRAVLFGFRPQYRGQSYYTFKLLFNALLLSSSKETGL